MPKKVGNFNCEICDFVTSSNLKYDNHILTRKHKILTEKMPKNAEIFKCDICHFVTSKKSNYDKHILTRKHKILTDPNRKNAKKEIKMFECCNCKKKYKHSSTLSSHTKKCNVILLDENIKNEIILDENIKNEIINSEEKDASNNEISILTNLVLELVKSNGELQKQMLDICKNSNNTIISNNSNNKTFNLQFFLNEQCKNAMNLNEFVGSFKFVLEDLLRVGEKGYVEGISYIILEKLKEMDIYQRPIHCSDLRRDTLFIKTDDIWCKEGPDNNKIAIAIKDIGMKNFPLLNEYKKLHPDCLESDSEFNDPYIKLIMHAAGGGIKENIDKIIKNIAKKVVIEK